MNCALRYDGGVKLLLRCLQSIQCQYYLVFGVVKTVPLQSFARLRVPYRPTYLPTYPLSPSLMTTYIPKYPKNVTFPSRHNGSTTTWRTVIDRYTYCIYSVYVVPSLLRTRARARARLSLVRPLIFLYSDIM